MENNEAEVREVIEQWVQAICSGDRPGILARHAPDVLMYDLPAPLMVRGIDAYARTWDYFYVLSRDPIVFELRDLEITAGSEVAFATSVVHCDGTSAGPLDLRLTMGLRKTAGQWIIVHEHHSMPVS